MKNKSLMTGLMWAAILAAAIYFTSCNPLGYDIWHEDDPYYSPPPPDSIPIDPGNTDTLPLVTDTCLTYEVVTTPKFCTWAINLDTPPLIYQFYIKSQGQYIEINLHNYLLPYGSSTEYFSGINVAGILTGFDNNNHALNQGIFIKDGQGTAYLLTFNPYNLVFNGTLTFDQFYSEFLNHLSFKRIGFWNTAFTPCDQYNQILDYLIDNCIDGHGKTLDLRAIPCTIDAEKINRLLLANFTILQ